MLARLQRAIVLALCAAAGVWAIAWIIAGSPVLAVLGAGAIMFGYSFMLGIEFTLQRAVNRRDPAPRANASQTLRAWWAETRAAAVVFGWRQPFCSRDCADWLPGRSSRERRAVVLVHGFVCNRGFWNPWMKRLRGHGVPYVAVDLEPVFASIDAYAGAIEYAVRRATDATGMAPIVVAHSMGGLAVRAWLARDGRDERVHRVVTIGTPHRGTWLGRFAMTTNARQMRLGSRWQQDLAAREPANGAVRFTCFYSHCDNVVFPASSATLPGADNRHVPGRAHVELAFQPEVFDEVLRWAGFSAPASEPRA